MIVERVLAERFRGLDAVDLALDGGLTVVRGPNEAGKSTIVEALLAGLFGRADDEALAADLRSWREARAPVVELTLRVGGERYELRRDFASGEQSLRERSTGLVERDPDRIARRLARLLGCPTRRFFESTACVRQDEMAAIDKDPDALAHKLEQLLTGPEDVTVAHALRDLARYRATLARGLDDDAARPGLLAMARRRAADLRSELVAARAAGERRRTWREALATAEAELGAARAETERLARRLAAARSAVDHARAARRLSADLAEREQREAIAAELATAEGRLRERSQLAAAGPEVERVTRLGEQANALDSLPVPPPPGHPQLLLGLLPVGGALTGGGAALALFLDPLGLVGVVVGLASLMAVLFTGRRSALVDQAAARAADLRGEASAIAERLGFRDPQALLAAYAERQTVEASRDAALRRLGQLLRREPTYDDVEALRQPRQDAGPELAAHREALRSLRAGDLPPLVAAYALTEDGAADEDAAAAELAALEGELARSRERTAAAEREVARHSALLEQPEQGAADVPRLEAELAAAEGQQALLERRLAALDVAAAEIERARGSLVSSVAAALAPAIARRLEPVTAGRYSAVRVDPRTLDVAVTAPGADEPVRPERLSRGTRDQVYLAARLAMVELLCDGRRPPLLVDDGLVAFDDERSARMLQALREFARERQVLLFTWSDRYDAFADRVVELGAPLRGG